MNITIKPSKLSGSLTIPPSKSLSHRAIIAASLASGESLIYNIQFSDDIISTIDIMKSLGAKISIVDSNKNIEDFYKVHDVYFTLKINGEHIFKNITSTNFNVRESGSTLRFLIPLSTLSNHEVTFIGEGKLPERPLGPYFKIFNEKGISYEKGKNNLPLKLNGELKGGKYFIDGNVSSQFITGLLFTLPLLSDNSEIIFTSKLESKPYIDLTLCVLKHFGIEVKENDNGYYIPGNQKYLNCEYSVEGDFSQAAFFLVAGYLGNNITSNNLNINSRQGDKVILDIIKSMGGKIIQNNTSFHVELNEENKNENEIIIDVCECPDLVPILAVMASFYSGDTHIINGERVRLKECDRLHAITEELNKIGGNITELSDGLIIKSVKNFSGGICNCHNDHRIAMALTIASTKCCENLYLTGAECVKKSYPNFYSDIINLGGKFEIT